MVLSPIGVVTVTALWCTFLSYLFYYLSLAASSNKGVVDTNLYVLKQTDDALKGDLVAHTKSKIQQVIKGG